MPFASPIRGLTNQEAASVVARVERGLKEMEVEGEVPELLIEVRSGRNWLAQGEVHRAMPS